MGNRPLLVTSYVSQTVVAGDIIRGECPGALVAGGEAHTIAAERRCLDVKGG
jgi:hypothetical protein